jgi:ankyrin repeat protein
MANHLRDSLHSASIIGDNECIKRLLSEAETGANPNEKDHNGFTPLHYATRYLHKDCIKTLLNAGANPNEKNNNGCTPLHTLTDGCIKWSTSTDEHIECMKTLIYGVCTIVAESGAELQQVRRTNINEQNNQGRTPLHYTTMYGHKESIIILLNAGANLDEKDNYGQEAFDMGSDNVKELINRWIEENEIKEPCEN